MKDDNRLLVVGPPAVPLEQQLTTVLHRLASLTKFTQSLLPLMRELVEECTEAGIAKCVEHTVMRWQSRPLALSPRCSD